jgi:hypothetical protein
MVLARYFYSLLLGKVRFFGKFFQVESGLAGGETVCSEPAKQTNFFEQNGQRFLKLFWENAQGFLEKKIEKNSDR